MKNITLSADEALIRKARIRAQKEGASLNDAFREWLQSYVAQDMEAATYKPLMIKLDYVLPGKRFSREELNER